MTEHTLLKALAIDLQDENEAAVKMYIVDWHSIRDAILYIDVYLKRNYLLEKFKKYAFCNCGEYSFHFIPDPTCRSCHFRKEMDKIEYGKPTVKESLILQN